MPAFWDTLRHPMITHTSDSQKKNAKISNFKILQET